MYSLLSPDLPVWYNAMGIASPVIQCSSLSSDAHIRTPHLQHPIVTLHNGFNVSVVMRRKSISVIDHFKCGPLFQQRNVLAQRTVLSALASCSKSSWGDSGLLSHIRPIFVLLSLLNSQGFLSFLSFCSLSIPIFVFAFCFPSSTLSSCSLVHHKKQVLYVSTQWPNEGVWVQTEGQKGKIKKNQTRQKRGEIGRKAWHQEGFSLVKQEVGEIKGQKEELFQSVTPLSHCFHCVLALMFAFMSGINKLQRIDVLCWLNEGICEFCLALMIHLTVVTIRCERPPRWCPGDDKLWNTPPSCLQTVHK